MEPSMVVGPVTPVFPTVRRDQPGLPGGCAAWTLAALTRTLDMDSKTPDTRSVKAILRHNRPGDAKGDHLRKPLFY